MKYFVFLFALSFSFKSINAQNKKAPTYVDKGYFMFPDDKILNYGLQDADGKEIIPPLYKNILFFSDEYLIANKIFNYYGLINLKNEEILPFKYKSIDKLKNGFATFKHDAYVGLLDAQANIVIPADKYTTLTHYSDGYCTFKQGLLFYGIVDRYGKEVINDNKYYYIKDVYNGFATVSINSKYGVVDLEDNIIIKLEFDDVKYLDNGLYITRKLITAGGVSNNQFGLKSTDGKVNIPEIYKDFNLLKDNQLVVQKFDGTFGIMNFNQEEIVPFKNRSLTYLTDSYYSLSDFFNGLEIYNYKHEKVSDMFFSEVISIADENAILATDKDKKNIYIYNSEMKLSATFPTSVKFQSQNDDRLLFRDNDKLFVVNLKTATIEKEIQCIRFSSAHIHNDKILIKEGTYADLWNLSNLEKKTFLYDEIIKFNEAGLARAKINGKFGVIDHLGNVIVPFTKNDLDISPDGITAAVDQSNLYNVDFFSKTGKKLFNISSSNYVANFKDNIAVKKLISGNYELIDTLGKLICNSGRLKPSLSGFTPYTDANYKKAIYLTTPDCKIKSYTQYIDGREFSENGLAAVKEASSGKWGYLNKNGDLIIPCIYDDVGNFFEGYALALFESKKILINANGKVIVNSENDDIGALGDGVVGVKKADKWGYVSASNGKSFISPKFENIGPFKDGYAWVKTSDKVGLIDKKGKTIIPFQYQFSEHLENGYSVVSKDNIHVGVVDRTNKTIVPIEYNLFGNIYNNHILMVKSEGWRTEIIK